MAPDKTLFVFITRGGGRYNTLHFRVCRIASFPIRPVDPCYISRRVVACLYSVVFTAELLVNTRRKPLVKQPVVVRDSDHGIPPCSEGIWSTTRVHASPVSRFVRGRRRTGKVRWKVRRRSIGCVLSHRCRDLDGIQFCYSSSVYDIVHGLRFPR